MAANPDNNFSKMEEKVDGKIYNEKGDVLNLSYIEFKSSCTHASGNRVTDIFSLFIICMESIYIYAITRSSYYINAILLKNRATGI